VLPHTVQEGVPHVLVRVMLLALAAPCVAPETEAQVGVWPPVQAVDEIAVGEVRVTTGLTAGGPPSMRSFDAPPAGWLIACAVNGRFAEEDRTEAGSTLYVNGQTLGIYDETRLPTFSRDGAHLAFAARRGGAWFVVLDGVEQAPCEAITYVGFCPRAGEIVTLERRSGQEWLCVDGYPVTEGEGLCTTPPVSLSPRGCGMLFVARGRTSSRIVLWTGRLHEATAGPNPLACRLGPEGLQVSEGPPRQAALVAGYAAWYPGSVGTRVASPGSRRLACVAEGSYSRDCLVVDGETVFECPTVAARIAGRTLVWSPDSSRLAFACVQDIAERVVVGDHTGPPYHAILAGPHFATPHLVRYLALRGRTVLWVWQLVDE
jgi:hypothetical protein